MTQHTIGLISDTHNLMRPEALAALAGVEHILHAGDVGGPEILAALREIAPVTAVRGNTDTSPWGQSLPLIAEFAIDDLSLCVIHDLMDFDVPPGTYRVVVSGHTHRSQVQEHHGVLFINPGAAGARRFNLPVSVALLHVDDDTLRVEIIELTV